MKCIPSKQHILLFSIYFCRPHSIKCTILSIGDWCYKLSTISFSQFYQFCISNSWCILFCCFLCHSINHFKRDKRRVFPHSHKVYLYYNSFISSFNTNFFSLYFILFKFNLRLKWSFVFIYDNIYIVCVCVCFPFMSLYVSAECLQKWEKNM